MKPISDIWPSVILLGGVGHADLVQERVGEARSRTAAGCRSGTSRARRRRTMRSFSSASASRPRTSRAVMPLARPRRRRVRQRQAVDRPSSDRRRRRRRVNMPALGLEPERADDEAGDDPADRAEHADARELAARDRCIVVERQRVGQRQRRHVAERVGEQHRVERRRTSSGVDSRPEQRRRRPGAAPPASSRWRRSGRPPCRRRTARSSPPAPSSRRPGRSADR